MNDASNLYQISKLDRELVRARKELESIPEAAQIIECRNKRKELKAKQDQVVELTDDVNSRLAALEQEEASAIAKLKELQLTLDTTTDYRMTSKLTDEMDMLVKRQAEISADTDALLERQIKIDHIANQVSDMLAKLDHREEHLVADFKAKGAQLKGKIQDIEERIAAATAQLDDQLVARYAKLKAEKGGIAVAHFEQTHCSACHTEFQAGALAKLKSGPEIAECPNCHRLFITTVVG